MKDSPEKHGPYPPLAPAPRGFANHVGGLGPEREKVKGLPLFPWSPLPWEVDIGREYFFSGWALCLEPHRLMEP